MPLVLLYTGARLEEIAQLETGDVADVDGVACNRITASAGEDGEEKRKSVKKAGSERTVPLHSGLITPGFLAYVAARREAGDRRVFPPRPTCRSSPSRSC